MRAARLSILLSCASVTALVRADDAGDSMWWSLNSRVAALNAQGKDAEAAALAEQALKPLAPLKRALFLGSRGSRRCAFS